MTTKKKKLTERYGKARWIENAQEKPKRVRIWTSISHPIKVG